MLDVCEWSEAIWGFVSWGGDGPEEWRHDAQSRGFSLSGMQEVGAPQTRMVSSQDASAVSRRVQTASPPNLKPCSPKPSAQVSKNQVL